MSELSTVTPGRLVGAALVGAGELLAEVGWYKCAYLSQAGKMCAAGAINKTLTGQATDYPSFMLDGLPDVTRRTVQATKRALLLHLAFDREYIVYLPHPARRLVLDPFVTTVPLSHYDSAIASWNDNRCRDADEAIETFRSVPRWAIERAVEDEFEPAAPAPLTVRLPAMRPVSDASTDRELLAVL